MNPGRIKNAYPELWLAVNYWLDDSIGRFAPKDSERIIDTLDEMWKHMSKQEKALIRKRCRSK